jgi:MFS family permease
VINLLLAAPPYIFMVIWSLLHSLASDRTGNRFWFFIYPVPIVLIGCFIFMFVENNGARYFSLFLMIFIFAMNGTVSLYPQIRPTGSSANASQTYAWIANSIPRPPAKRAAALAFINSFGNAASIWTPFTYFKWSAPYYHPAMGIIIALTAIAGICGIIHRWLLERDNKRLARLENESVPLSESDLRKLQKTADMEGIDIATARQLQKGYRFMI